MREGRTTKKRRTRILVCIFFQIKTVKKYANIRNLWEIHKKATTQRTKRTTMYKTELRGERRKK